MSLTSYFDVKYRY